MTARLVAAARTPWSLRHGPLAATAPHVLLQIALAGVADRLGPASSAIDRVLVACDPGVGAQDLNIARRAGKELGWDEVPALTIDGQGVAGLGLVGLACSLPGRTVVAGIDATSIVPPGAGLVRDYGRPTMDQPEVSWLEETAARRGLNRAALDHVAKLARADRGAEPAALVPVATPGGDIGSDVGDERELGDDLAPLVGPDGLQTARHLAEYADGAAAVVVEGGARTGRTITGAELVARPDDDVLGWLAMRGARTAADERAVVAEPSAVVLALLADDDVEPALDGVPSVLSLGSSPSTNGLRMLVDAVHSVPGRCTVIERGRHGQLSSVSIDAS